MGTGFLLQHSAATNQTLRLDSLSIEGTAAIPEPSAYAAFIGLGVLGSAASRRRRAA